MVTLAETVPLCKFLEKVPHPLDEQSTMYGLTNSISASARPTMAHVLVHWTSTCIIHSGLECSRPRPASVPLAPGGQSWGYLGEAGGSTGQQRAAELLLGTDSSWEGGCGEHSSHHIDASDPGLHLLQAPGETAQPSGTWAQGSIQGCQSWPEKQ